MKGLPHVSIDPCYMNISNDNKQEHQDDPDQQDDDLVLVSSQENRHKKNYDSNVTPVNSDSKF